MGSIEPGPRRYPDWVTLLRRLDGRPADAPDADTVDGVADWLLGRAVEETDLMALFAGLVWRLVAAGLPLDRASLHVGTLHPQLYGFAWNWNRSDGLCDEVKVAERALQSDSYLRNPLHRVIAHGETVRCDPRDAAAASRFPLMAELAGQGFTDYLAVPLRGGGAYHNAATAATRQPGGFSAGERAGLDRVLRLFALHVERHIAERIAANVLDTYLGAAAGAKVLRGAIKRGAGEPIRAVIWASDLRGFTDLADRLPGEAVIALLNAYFERQAGAVMSRGGEVLKFIGDGLLAVFPHAAFAGGEPAAAGAALAAAEAALADLATLNREPPPDLAAIAGWRPLRCGIALHEGEVFFGNVGAPDRLDFTVIGRAVNTAARVEGLTKQLGRDILLTEPVARALDRPLERLGEHRLRGFARPIAVYAPAGAGGTTG